jgi:hypothetical protein
MMMVMMFNVGVHLGGLHNKSILARAGQMSNDFVSHFLQYLSNHATIRSSRSTRWAGSPPRLISWPSRG